MAFYQPLSGIIEIGSPYPTALLGHMITLVISVALCIYAIMGIQYIQRLFKSNWQLLAITFGLLTLIPLGNLFEHLDIYPGEETWHHIRILLNIASFYFMYRFVMSLETKSVLEERDVVALVAILAGVALVAPIEESLESGGTAIFLFFTVIASLLCFYLFRMFHKLGQTMLKSLLISLIPKITLVMFIIMTSQVLLEFVMIHMLNLATDPISLGLIALQDPLYVMLGLLLTLFTSLAKQLDELYKPMENFTKRNSAAGSSKS